MYFRIENEKKNRILKYMKVHEEIMEVRKKRPHDQ